MKILNQHTVYLIAAIVLLSLSTCNQKQKDTAKVETEITDSMITNAIKKEYVHYPEVPFQQINVNTLNGIVKLTGTTNNILAKEKAEEITSMVRGVEGILNQLMVEPQFISDKELKSNIQNTIYHDPIIDSYEINAKVNNGHVIISGLVDSWSEKRLAEDIIKSVEGIKSVTNNLNIHYKDYRPDSEIAADVSGILHFDAFIDHRQIDAEVKNGVVRLSGYTGSLFEKNRAVNRSWVVGVDTVIADRLKISSNFKNEMITKKRFVKKPDHEIQNAIEKLLLYDARVNSAELSANVKHGVVSLEGKVDNLRAKNAAYEDAKNTIGVREVKNNIKVVPKIATTRKAVEDNIRVAIKLHPELKTANIDLQQINGKILLSGFVNHQGQKNKTEALISKIPGVEEIDNKLKIADIIQPTSTYEKGSIELKEDIEMELWWSPFINENNISVKVEDKSAILSGKAETQFEKEMAVKNALQAGASAVVNNIIVE